MQEKKEVKKCKKTLNILRIAATDKENLTSKFNKKKSNNNSNKAQELKAKRSKKNIVSDNTESILIKSNINKTKPDQAKQSLSLLETDLIIDNPSEHYWQKLAESHRRAVEITLKENVELHNKVNELEYENSRLKAMLEEAKSLVEVLTEMIEENDDNSNKSDFQGTDNAEENFVSGENKEVSSESDMEEMSFQSCL